MTVITENQFKKMSCLDLCSFFATCTNVLHQLLELVLSVDREKYPSYFVNCSFIFH